MKRRLFVHSAEICVFDQRAVIDHGIVKAESSGKIVGFKTVALQNTATNIAAQTALTNQDYFIGSHF